MSDAKHTPGPWEVLGAGNPPLSIHTPSGPMICSMGYADDEPAENADANARLIAAAPDLLAAVKALCYSENPQEAVPLVLEMGYAAIRKATGGSDA